MRNNRNRFHRGSALLIVLGMLSFMVVSAVGFSVYMRQSRAPSSYLGRNVSSRYLVKAALANAIEDLEGGFMTRYDIGIDDTLNPDLGYFYGIYDDPYPGVGSQSSEDFSKMNKTAWTKNGNFWFKRVFCPFGLLSYPKNATRAVTELPETAPTLTLEALAYLPPALVDDVRVVSRLTRTAQWHTLPYSAGRYAYTCVNVSDLFDINKLRAGEPRDSGINRITLATLTSSAAGDPSRIDAGRADTLDMILEKVEQSKIGGNTVPFVSLADFNLSAAGSRYAPLMSYIGGTANGLTLSSEAANGLFITDTWFSGATNAAAATKKKIDLGGVNGSGQPFKTDAFMVAKRSLLTMNSLLNKENNVNKIYEKNLGGVGLTCLYDYLDSDSIPSSLVLPTVEAVPMAVGVSPPAGLSPTFGSISQEQGQFQVQGFYFDTDGNRIAAPVTIQRTCELQGFTDFGNINIPCVVAYPFKRMVTTRGLAVNNGYKFRGLLRVWLAPDGMGCRPNTAQSLYPAASDIIPLGGTGQPVVREGVATFFSDNFSSGTSLNKFSTDVTKTDEAVVNVNLMFRNTTLKMPAFWKVTETILQNMPGQTLQADASLYSAKPYYSLANMAKDTSSLRPLGINGEYHADWQSAVVTASRTFDINGAYPNGLLPLTAAPATKYRLYAAVWVQVLDSMGRVVDMAPAAVDDDEGWLSALRVPGGIADRICGGGVPLLNFETKTDLTFDQTLAATLTGPQSFDKWGCLYAADPRYNWAPEDWFADASATADASTWKDLVAANFLGKNGRDRDIFMFVSDQEYLQSIGELQFLPVVSVMDGTENFPEGSFANVNYNGLAFSARTGASSDNLIHKGRFWRTYTGYNNGDVAALDDLNPYNLCDESGNDVEFTSGTGTFKVNPYSEDERILMSVFAGTPFDYYVSSTNDNQQQVNGHKNHLLKSDLIDFDTMRTKYSFGEPTIATFSSANLLGVMDTVVNGLRNNKNKEFDEIWEDLPWQSVGAGDIGESNPNFLGVSYLGGGQSYLHGVDRKFLFSYWRDCFANDQQLFLFFVRAEPCSVGGGASGGVSSAQLGGRAVALVWRDPNRPGTATGGTRKDRANITSRETFREVKKNCAPHHTRVLFYHQFD